MLLDAYADVINTLLNKHKNGRESSHTDGYPSNIRIIDEPFHKYKYEMRIEKLCH